MMQIYVLSILLNALAGFTLVIGSKKQDVEEGYDKPRAGLKLALGAAAFLVGIIKLFAPWHRAGGHGLPILGDFLPAVAGIVCGLFLVYDFYRTNSAARGSCALDEAAGSKIGSLVDRYSVLCGGAGIASAVLHFLLPGVPIL
jgi:hypothetical protein